MMLSIDKSKFILRVIALSALTLDACQKLDTLPTVSGVASLTVVNAIPYSTPISPVINTSGPINFSTTSPIGYGDYIEYFPIASSDTIYAVQQNGDTLHIGPKFSGLMYYGIQPLKDGGSYSLFLCGADTSSPDFLFTTDSLPYHSPSDSTVGIRFVNLSAGSTPMSVTLEGSPNGSSVSSLPYKGITGFMNYPSNSTVSNYLFVFRDAITGDSLATFTFAGNNGYGLVDPYNYALLTFKNITIGVYGSENSTSNFPLNTMIIDNYGRF